ncbi:hypothetical protein RSOL_355180, partial [Rhizoctonia solani AG-3 Rhs1AP]
MASRSKGLELNIMGGEITSFHSDMFELQILGCNPKIFKALRIYSSTTPFDPFVMDFDDSGWKEDDDYVDSDMSVSSDIEPV